MHNATCFLLQTRHLQRLSLYATTNILSKAIKVGCKTLDGLTLSALGSTLVNGVRTCPGGKVTAIVAELSTSGANEWGPPRECIFYPVLKGGEKSIL